MTEKDNTERRHAGPVVGIPRALTWFRDAGMWAGFFYSIGVDVIVSPPTNKKILDNGLSLAVDESCLPTKIYLGHVKNIIDRKPDYVFVSRQQDFSSGEVLCTKFWGMPDICRNTFDLPDGCKWLELNISPSIDGITDFKAWKKIGAAFTSNPLKIRRAYYRGRKIQDNYTAWIRSGLLPEESLKLAMTGSVPDQPPSNIRKPGEMRIALLGHSYLIHDEHFGLPVIKLLKKLGVSVCTVDELDINMCRSLGREVSPSLYWTYNREIVGAAEHYMNDSIDGVVLIEAFPCGPDALVFDLLTRKMCGRAPIVRLVMDELQALTGIQTRLESFVDILQMRKEEVAIA